MRNSNFKQLSAVLKRNIAFTLAFAVLVWVLSWYVRTATVAFPDFDGALNLNVSQAVLNGEGYGSFYETFAIFPIQTQTNGPLVLPAAASIALLGQQPLAYSVVNLGYVLALALVLFALARRLELPGWAGLLIALLALQVPGMRDFAMFGYGEVAAVCWALLAIYVLLGQLDQPDVRWVAWGGFLLGLSFLTKTVSLIWFPSIVAIFVGLILRERSWRLAVKSGVALGVGIILAALLWEAYRLYNVGGSDGYLRWWETQWLEISKQAGVEPGYEDTPSLWTKILLHTRTLAMFLSVSVAQMLGVLFVALLAAFWVVLRTPLSLRKRYFLLVVASIAALYLLWWIAITPTIMMWLRRIMLGLLFLQLALILLAIDGLLQRSPAVKLSGGLLLLTALGISASGQLLWQRPDRSANLPEDQVFFRAVADLPLGALTFGSGWWQNPVTALVSGRKMQNEEAWTKDRFLQEGKHGYWVFDRYATTLDEHVRNRFAWRCDCEPVYAGAGGQVFRIRELYDTPEASRSAMIRLRAESPMLADGFAPDTQSGLRLAGSRSQIQLDTDVLPAQLLINYHLPLPPTTAAAANRSISLQVKADGCDAPAMTLIPGNANVMVSMRCTAPVRSFRLDLYENAGPLDSTAPVAWLIREVQVHPSSIDSG
jgi:hypothetical protein